MGPAQVERKGHRTVTIAWDTWLPPLVPLANTISVYFWMWHWRTSCNSQRREIRARRGEATNSSVWLRFINFSFISFMSMLSDGFISFEWYRFLTVFNSKLAFMLASGMFYVVVDSQSILKYLPEKFREVLFENRRCRHGLVHWLGSNESVFRCLYRVLQLNA